MQNEGANVKAEINKRKIEIERLKGLQNMAPEVPDSQKDAEVLDPWAALQQLEAGLEQQISQSEKNNAHSSHHDLSSNHALSGNHSNFSFQTDESAQLQSLSGFDISSQVYLDMQGIPDDLEVEPDDDESDHESFFFVPENSSLVNQSSNQVSGDQVKSLPTPVICSTNTQFSQGWNNLKIQAFEERKLTPEGRKRLFGDVEAVPSTKFMKESILPNEHPEEEETLIAEAESITDSHEHEINVKILKTDLEASSSSYLRDMMTARGCRCVDLAWDNSEHTTDGTLRFSLLNNYRGPGLEWKTFLGVYAPKGPVMYEFELGKAGHLFYLRAYSEIQSCHNDRWEIRLTNKDPHSFDSILELEGEFVPQSKQTPRVLPSTFDVTDTREFTVIIRQ